MLFPSISRSRYGESVRGLRLVVVSLLVGPFITSAAVAAPHKRPDVAGAPIAVTPFSGLHGDEPQAAVLRQLGERAALVKPADAAKAQPYVIISGAVVRRDAALVVEVDIIAADTRQRVAQVTMPVPPGRHLSPQQLAELARQVDDAATQAMAPPPAPPAPPPPPPAPPPQAQDTEKAGIPAPLETSTPTPISITPPPPKHPWLPAVPRPRWYPWVEATAGVIVDSRSLAFHPATPPAYAPGTGAGVHVDVTVYPLAWLHALEHGLFAGLGAGVTVDKPFWPTTRFVGTPSQYATDELRVEGGARWRFIVRRWRPRLELTVGAGAGLHTYAIAKATDPMGRKVDAGPPDVAYVYGTVGAGLRVVVWHERLMPWISGAYEYVPDAGSVENVDEYGDAHTNGVMLRGGLDVRVWRRLRVGAGGFWELMGLRFIHDLPTQKSAIRAVDQFFGGIFTVGYDY